MPEKKVVIKKDPLLEEGESQVEKPAKVEKVEKAKTKIETGLKTPGKSIKEQALAKFPNDVVAQTKFILDNGEKVNFIVPMGENEAVGAVETTQINGYKLTIQKGILVNIPLAIANLIAEKYRINMAAGQEKRLDHVAADVTAALE